MDWLCKKTIVTPQSSSAARSAPEFDQAHQARDPAQPGQISGTLQQAAESASRTQNPTIEKRDRNDLSGQTGWGF